MDPVEGTLAEYRLADQELGSFVTAILSQLVCVKAKCI